MKTPSNPPSKPLTEKRQKILALAMAQMKKTRAQMDPNILKKIRGIIASNPKIMKGLGIDKMPEDKAEEKTKEKVERKAPVQQAVKKDITKTGGNHPLIKPEKPAPKVAKSVGASQNPQVKKEGAKKATKAGEEVKIDKAHNMEVLSKLMALKPSEIENIKSVLLGEKK